MPGSAVRPNLMAQDDATPGRDQVRSKRWGIAPTATFGPGTARARRSVTCTCSRTTAPSAYTVARPHQGRHRDNEILTMAARKGG